MNWEYILNIIIQSEPKINQKFLLIAVLITYEE